MAASAPTTSHPLRATKKTRQSPWCGAATIREAPPEERPRERLLRHGAAVLSDAELLSLLLEIRANGSGDLHALHQADALLTTHGGLAGLVGTDLGLLLHQGVSEAGATVLLAALELARRLARADLPDRVPLNRPAQVASYLALRYTLRDQEVMGCLLVDIRNRLLAEREVYRGTLERAAVEPREILKEALLRGAAGVVLFHSHPSGDPSPSAEDLTFTRRMAEAAKVVGVKLVDHLIVGSASSWVSLKERGAF